MSKIARVGEYGYKVFNGQLESVKILSEGLADETCTIPSWLVKDCATGRKSRRSIGSFYASPKEAWEAELKEYEEAIIAQKDYIHKQENHLVHLLESKAMVEQMIENEKW